MYPYCSLGVQHEVLAITHSISTTVPYNILVGSMSLRVCYMYSRTGALSDPTRHDSFIPTQQPMSPSDSHVFGIPFSTGES